MIYSTDWYSSNDRKSDFLFLISPECPTCNYNVRNYNPDSTAKDIVISSMVKHCYNLIPCLRSLRTTGSKCGMIVLADKSVLNNITREFAQLVLDCGCKLICIGEIRQDKRMQLFMVRNVAIYDLLRARSHFFDRIIIIDLFDTIFQGDPFSKLYDNNCLTFSQETAFVRGSHFQGALILVGNETAKQKILMKPMINCGTISGKYKFIIIFLQLWINLSRSIDRRSFQRLVKTQYADQTLVNVLVRCNILQDHGVPVRLYTYQDQQVVLHKIFKLKLDFRIGEFKGNESKYYPSLIHLYDRSQSFCRSVIEACPPTFQDPNYNRCKFTKN